MKSAFVKGYLVWGIAVYLFFSMAALGGWKFPWPESSGSGSSYYGTSGNRSSWGTYGGGK